MERNCDNCKYRDVYYKAPPCDECNFEYQRQPQKGFQNWEPDAMTNADRIRAMTDEELARFMWNRDIDIVEKAAKATGFTYTVDMEKCFENVLNWLKQECDS